MNTTLVILVHPEAMSFNGQWAAATASAASALGHELIWSDLYRMDFDPAEGPKHFSDHDGFFDPLKAQELAAKNHALSVDVAAEIDKIKRADRLIFHFPMWWFGPPAMLKGWFDRVLAHGALHNVEQRFDTGMCRGKKALFCVTTGSSEFESTPSGREGNASMLLWPSAYILRYCGFDVLEPIIVHGVHGYQKGDQKVALEARLQDVLRSQTDVLSNFDELRLTQFNADDDFDDKGQLKSDAKSVTDFIKR